MIEKCSVVLSADQSARLVEIVRSYNLKLWTGPARGGRGQAGLWEASGVPFQGNHTHTRETGGKVRRCRRTIHTKSW